MFVERHLEIKHHFLSHFYQIIEFVLILHIICVLVFYNKFLVLKVELFVIDVEVLVVNIHFLVGLQQFIKNFAWNVLIKLRVFSANKLSVNFEEFSSVNVYNLQCWKVFQVIKICATIFKSNFSAVCQNFFSIYCSSPIIKNNFLTFLWICK